MLQNTLFIENAEEDLEHFLKSDKRKRVLIFPPVNNYRRFLIHQLVQERYSELLQTFSIGQGFARRTVVCYKTDFIGPPKVNGEISQTNEFVGRSFDRMGIESQCTPTASPEHSKPRQMKSTPAYEIYRPPAARRARLEKSPVECSPSEQTSTDPTTKPNRQKRPDRAVYVPRHRRSAPEVETTNVPVKDAQSKIPKETASSNSKMRSNRTKSKSPQTTITNNTTIEKIEVQVVEAPTHVKTTNEINIQTEGTESTNLLLDINNSEKIQEQSVIAEMSVEIGSPNKNVKETAKSREKDDKNESENVPAYSEESDKRDRRKSMEIDEDSNNTSDTLTHTNISDNNKSEVQQSTTSNSQNSKSDNNKQNDGLVKQPLVSKVLVISSAEAKQENPDPAPSLTPTVVPMTPPEKKVKKVERPKSKPAAPPALSVKIDRDECDWESLFDDNGDCLDPTLIEELSSSVGEVVIEKPKSNFKAFSQPIEVSNDEYAHIVEIYNFPTEFKSIDLAAVFSPWKSGGFELKWVDDTHCLGVFSSPLVAAEVLASEHPFVKTRPLSEASSLSKSKVRKSSEFLQPYRTRPETCAALARRLVTKSLGVTLATARQEREQEKIVLREAKEKRRLANKQREDVWEGIIANKSSS
ncbi:uncharacterized protein LOC131673771 [Phymastichus coffea]|uniref:uncharacterized protein LOC131673771 n=1 Tax=Phymastichus coffea TaxID=108790 RepID=UPI00273C63BC|nr:uncharacterized protein LOC131673771 [Phymastichus coffea]